MTAAKAAESGLLLDTHVWIWLALGVPGKLQPETVARIDEAGHERRLFLSIISVWELAMLHAKGRVHLPMPLGTWVDRALAPPELTLLPMARAVMWAATVLLLVAGQWPWAVAALAIELCAFLPVRVGAMRRLGAGRIVWFTIPLEWLFLILEPALYFSTILIPPRRWK